MGCTNYQLEIRYYIDQKLRHFKVLLAVSSINAKKLLPVLYIIYMYVASISTSSFCAILHTTEQVHMYIVI